LLRLFQLTWVKYEQKASTLRETNNAVSKVISIKEGQIFQRKELILDQIEFEVEENEIVYMIGKTGSGKSSLLKCLYGEIPLFRGSGEIVGYDLKKLKRKQIPLLRRKLGIVFQDFQLLTDRTVQQNLFFVMKSTGWMDKKSMAQRAEEILALVGLESKMHANPWALSGGEQQRLSIARALINRPEIILADEPTGNLDPETSEEIMRLLIAIAQEQKSAVLMATHDMNMVEKYPGRVVKVEDKLIKEVHSIDRFNPFEPFSA
jgi:cell division transport system ATP-binding protein